ncbi:MAG: arginase family protein [Hyphomicrobiaceae bacterium]
MKVTLIYAYWPNQPGGVTWCDLPWALRDKGLPKRLHEAGHEVMETILMAEEPSPDEMRAGLNLAAEVTEAVADAAARGELAVVLAGSCALSAIGSIGGLGGSGTAIAWFDAHPDLNTPETSTSGLFEGMALAAATGKAWRAMVAAHAGLAHPADLSRATLFGARDIDPAERALIDAHAIEMAGDPGSLVNRVGDAARVYAHLDMDVHDALTVRTSGFAVPGGPAVDDVRAALTAITNLTCLGITGLDPAAPDAAQAADIAVEHVLAIAGARS